MKFILTVTYGDFDTWEKHIGIEASDRDALALAIIDAIQAQRGEDMRAADDLEREQILTPEKRREPIYRGPWEVNVEHEGQKFEVMSDFQEHRIQTLVGFFETHRAERF